MTKIQLLRGVPVSRSAISGPAPKSSRAASPGAKSSRVVAASGCVAANCCSKRRTEE